MTNFLYIIRTLNKYYIMEAKKILTPKEQRLLALETGELAGIKKIKSFLSFDLKNLSNEENKDSLKNHLHHLSKDEGKILVNFIMKKYKVDVNSASKILYYSVSAVSSLIEIVKEIELNKINDELNETNINETEV